MARQQIDSLRADERRHIEPINAEMANVTARIAMVETAIAEANERYGQIVAQRRAAEEQFNTLRRQMDELYLLFNDARAALERADHVASRVGRTLAYQSGLCSCGDDPDCVPPPVCESPTPCVIGDDCSNKCRTYCDCTRTGCAQVDLEGGCTCGECYY